MAAFIGGGMVRNIVKSLDLAVDALVNDEFAFDEAIRLMAKPLIPGWMYTTIGNLSWRKQAKRYGARKSFVISNMNTKRGRHR